MAEKGFFTFDIHPDDAPSFRLVVSSRDVSLWERTHRGRNLKQLESTLSVPLFEEVAAVACRRQGKALGSLEEFRENVGLDVVDTAAAELRKLLACAVDEGVISADQADAILELNGAGGAGEDDGLDPTQRGR